jgi:hypothetical protein
LFFSIDDGSRKLFTAKFKKSRVVIFAGERVPRLSENPDGVVLVGKGLMDFCYRQSAVSQEIMTIRVAPRSTPVDTARRMSVHFFIQVEGVSGLLVSRNPRLSEDGRAHHEFDGRVAMDSVKNAVLAAKGDGPPLLMIRKTGKDVLELDVAFKHDVPWIFAIGIASFLSKVK